MKILILGSGYVGTHLGEFLQNHHSVTVTTRSEDRLIELKKSFKSIKLLNTQDLKALTALVVQFDIIIVTVAAKNMNEYEKAYLQTAINLKKAIKDTNHNISQIIYTSASSVYGDQNGSITSEEAPLSAKTATGKILIKTEKTLLECATKHLNVCIFRLSEIYGPSREISLRVKTLSELSAPGTGLNPTNMIHLDDIISAISFAIKHKLSGIFNLCDDDHIARKDMYDIVSKNFHLPSVIFDETKTSIHSGSKILSNEKIKKMGFRFLHPNRIYI